MSANQVILLPIEGSVAVEPTTLSKPKTRSPKKPKVLTAYELKVQREAVRREKACLRMAKKRAELKLRPTEEQEVYRERARAYQATYREKHRYSLRVWEAQRRVAVYKERFGIEAYKVYAKAKRERKRRARAKREAKLGLGHRDRDAPNAKRKGRDGGRQVA
ncbi:hypothetical protein B0H11DRAFT_2228266 [Mycena galericulata]|nr:hypothetical protein B0H11DRAFT_2228266 [Mycena galericulata]